MKGNNSHIYITHEYLAADISLDDQMFGEGYSEKTHKAELEKALLQTLYDRGLIEFDSVQVQGVEPALHRYAIRFNPTITVTP